VRVRSIRILAILGVAVAAVGASTALLPASAAAVRPGVVRAALPPGTIKHILVIDLENEGYAATFGPTSPATYLNGILRPKGELIEHYYGIGHVSLDNYVAQLSGQSPTRDTIRDCLSTVSGALFGYVNVAPGTKAPSKYPAQVLGNGCVYPKGVPTIASQLDAKYPPNAITHVAKWRAYAEDMGNVPTRDGGVTDPSGGTDCAHPVVGGPDTAELATPTDQFTTRHVGWLFFHSIIDNAAECDANVVPLGTLTSGVPNPDGHLAMDLSSIATTPMFATITPNLCDDGHDATCAGTNDDGTHVGGLVGADDWLAHWMPLILASPAYASGSMLVVITFDESDLSGAGANDACCHEQPGPNVTSPVNGQTSDKKAPGGGQVGALLLNPTWLHTGTVDTTGSYNHYSALRSFEDLLGLTTGGSDGLGHLGYAGQKGLVPFGKDVFK
jgi:hypothetical protein